MGDEAGGPARYRAFISYSHRDAAFGRRLHRRLEGYVLPRRLVARGAPRRLSPIFRDREELSAAHNLTTEVLAALAASETLVVVCSPNAAASPWVAREIEEFRRLHGERRPVLAAIAAGEPGECFPTPLTEAGEPLAADFRREGDGPRLALLKLVAGIAGVRLDELVQRDAQRRLAGVMAVTAASVAAMLAMGALTAFAFSARAEAERQRAEAEALVEFMLTDLRDQLKGVGRLDVLGAVNREAHQYYARQDLSRLPVASLERRARVLHAMGEDDDRRGDVNRALAQFQEARRTTAALLAKAPDDPERIFNHAQSEYWVAYIDYRRGRPAAAKAGWTTYRNLAERMVALAPDKAKYLRELGYAEGNLCTVALEAPKDPKAALAHCAAGLAAMQKAARRLPGDVHVALDLNNRHAWLADAYKEAGDDARALEQRRAQEALLDPLIAADPKNMEMKEDWIALQRSMAELEYRQGQVSAARDRLVRTRSVVSGMVAFDPENYLWRQQQARIVDGIAYLDDNPKP